MNKFTQSSVLMISLLFGCQVNRVDVSDQRPNYVPVEQTKSTVMLTVEDEDSKRFAGSAIVLTSEHLLTNRHVWVHGVKPWWESDLLKEQKVGFYYICDACDKLHHRSCIFELVAAGEVNSSVNSTELYKDKALSDWALIKTTKPFWANKNCALIYPPAINPQWRVPDETDIYILGFSSIFRGDESKTNFIKNGPYTIAAKSILVDGNPAALYESDWPTPLGHSGGGVYVWNDESDQLELIGIFHSKSSATTSANFFDVIKIPIGKTKLLFYSPISDAMQELIKDF